MSLAGALEFLQAIIPYVMSFFKFAATAEIGAKLKEGQQDKQALDKIYDADKAVAAARGWSPDDRLRHLEQRGRVRDLS